MRFAIVAGARPNFMKIAPILAAFRLVPGPHSVLLVHTGQHYDQAMSGDFFRDLGIPEPDVNLNVGSGSHAEQTARVMVAFEQFCLQSRPDWVVVVGDINSTLACAITAKKLGIRLAHVEAGLRSRDMTMPEEVNRLCTDSISDILFTTDEFANETLQREGVPEGRVRFVGNTMIDTLFAQIGRALKIPLPEGLCARQYAVLTLHRPSNVDHPDVLSGILDAIASICDRITVVFPVHPRTRRNLNGFNNPNLMMTEPLSYLDFLGLVARSRMVLTDSGGIQEETTVLGIPCITMRRNTERPVTCQAGTNRLVGSDPTRIREAAFAVLGSALAPHRIPAKWDGHAAERIVNTLLAYNPRQSDTYGDIHDVAHSAHEYSSQQ
jgi:UDP-N-acetylglucosamine 2-epimerase (non-hydrolysing)